MSAEQLKLSADNKRLYLRKGEQGQRVESQLDAHSQRTTTSTTKRGHGLNPSSAMADVVTPGAVGMDQSGRLRGSERLSARSVNVIGFNHQVFLGPPGYSWCMVRPENRAGPANGSAVPAAGVGPRVQGASEHSPGNPVTCSGCGVELRPSAKFCDECGSRVVAGSSPAEYKQVTVLFADVAQSMDIAAAVDAERLREIMTELVNRSAAVVHRYGGTVDKFTGDGIMAVFGAPVALEDHALRACLAALGVQEEAKRLAVDVDRRDGVSLQLRVGLSSGEVVAGGIGSGVLGYTAIGEQVGLAQRMESVAAPETVLLSESTARLVEGVTVLGEIEQIRIKGAEDPVPVRQLFRVVGRRRDAEPVYSTLMGREWELDTLATMLDRAVAGRGCVVGVTGRPGIGKTRLVREAMRMAKSRGILTFSTICESHTADVPFHAVGRQLRAAARIGGMDDETARALMRVGLPDADPQDMLLLARLSQFDARVT